MRRFLALLVVFLVTGVFASGGPPADPQEEVIPLGTSMTMRSEILGEDRELWIHTPPGYEDADSRYPVLVLLDGEYAFPFAVGIVDFLAKTNRIPWMLVVGVVNADRARDLTPEPGEGDRKRYPSAGQAAKFLRFLEQELLPWVDARFRTRPFRILAGHSLGGLFTVHAMLEGRAFDAFIASSPSLYWNDQSQVREAKDVLATSGVPGKYLFFSVGAEREEMVRGVESLAGVLESSAPEELAWRFAPMEDKDHEQTSFPSLFEGLEFIFEDYRDAAPVTELGFDAYRQRLNEQYGYDISVPVGTLFAATPHAQRRSCRDMVALMEYWSEHQPGLFRRFMEDWIEEGKDRLDRGDPSCAVDVFELLSRDDEVPNDSWRETTSVPSTLLFPSWIPLLEFFQGKNVEDLENAAEMYEYFVSVYPRAVDGWLALAEVRLRMSQSE